MIESLTSLAERRQARAAAGRVTPATAVASAASAASEAEASEPLLHTTFHITHTQRLAVAGEASQRMENRVRARHDKSAVLRDVIDFWMAHRQQFDEWLRAKRTGK